MEDNGSLREHDLGQIHGGEPSAGAGSSTTLTDELRHSGGSGGEASIGD